MARTGVDKADKAMTAKLFQSAMVTLLIAELTGALTAIIDSMLTGRFLGAGALAAFGLGGPYFSIASIISGILMVGSINMMTKAVGRGDSKGLSGVYSLTVTLGVALSALFCVGGLVFTEGLAGLFGAKAASAEVFSDTVAYLRGVFIGAPGFIMFVVLTPMLQLDGATSLPKVASVVSAAVDIAGDLLSIFVFDGGMFGMGLASAISHYAALAVVLLHFAGKKKRSLRYSAKEMRAKNIAPLLKDGAPRAVCMLGRALLPILRNALVLRVAGDAGVTALSAGTGSSFALGSLGWGIGGAVLMMSGIMVGEQNTRGLKTVFSTAVKDILIGVTALAAAVFCVSPFIAAVFIPEAGATRDMATSALRCYACCLPFLAFNVSAAGYLQALSRVWASNLVNIGIEVALPAAAAYALSSFTGITGVWLAFPIGQALLSALIVISAFAFRNKSRSGAEAYMFLPRGFGVSDDDLIEASPQTVEESAAFAERLAGFCAERGVDAKTANRLALCAEEMAVNVIKHGFTKDGKPHNLAVRVIVKDGAPVLRLRDDCVLFNFKEKAEKWEYDPENPEKGVGIRTVMAAAKDISYSSTMKTNNLIITV